MVARGRGRAGTTASSVGVCGIFGVIAGEVCALLDGSSGGGELLGSGSVVHASASGMVGGLVLLKKEKEKEDEFSRL